MNTRSIKTVRIWIAGSNKSADTLQLYNFAGYDFTSSPASFVSYRMGKAGTDQDGNPTFESLSEGSITLPVELVDDWGSDDTPIWDYVATALNLTFI